MNPRWCLRGLGVIATMILVAVSTLLALLSGGFVVCGEDRIHALEITSAAACIIVAAALLTSVFVATRGNASYQRVSA